MRLFFAILPEENFRAGLEEMQAALRRQGVKGNYTRPENLHLTLAFLGEWSDPEGVLEAAEAAEFSPFSLRLAGFGAFDRLYWAGVERCPALDAYVAALRRALAGRGIPFDRKKFRPHITLVRQAVLSSPGQGLHISVPRRSMEVSRVSLMRSDRGKSGMIYTEIGEISSGNSAWKA